MQGKSLYWDCFSGNINCLGNSKKYFRNIKGGRYSHLLNCVELFANMVFDPGHNIFVYLGTIGFIEDFMSHIFICLKGDILYAQFLILGKYSARSLSVIAHRVGIPANYQYREILGNGLKIPCLTYIIEQLEKCFVRIDGEGITAKRVFDIFINNILIRGQPVKIRGWILNPLVIGT